MKFDARQIYTTSGTGEKVPAYVLGETEYNRMVSALGVLEAVNRNEAVIEFDVDGTILTANPNFCQAMGYALEEIVGEHHRIFVKSDYASSQDYRDFWQKLGRGEHVPGEFCRVHKSGRDIWIRASYNPAVLPDGTVAKVVKVARDITAQRTVTNIAEQALRHLGGMQIARFTNEAMHRIESATKEIGSVTAEINQLAGRSKLLGINASIEASHAGAAGRGFSVVATEMCSLAEHSDSSANRINLLVDQAGEATQSGRDFITRVSDEVTDVVTEVIALYDLLTRLEARQDDEIDGTELRRIADSLAQKLAA